MGIVESLQKIVPKNFFAKKGKSVLGVDVSSSTMKVVQLRRKGGKAVLETYGELALGPYAGIDTGKATNLPAQKLGEALKDLLKESKVTTNSCGVAIPLSASLINVISMPDLGEKRLKDMVPIEVRKYIPVSISEVLLDWRVVPGSHTGDVVVAEKEKTESRGKKVDVLAVAIHKDTISRFQQVIKTAGLTASFFEIEVFSTIRSVLEDTLSPVVILDLGAATTKLFVVDRKVLRESHSINRGSQDITFALSKSMGISPDKAEELKQSFGVTPQTTNSGVMEVVTLVLDGILSEAHRAVLGYQKKHNKNIGMVVLVGGGAVLKGITEHTQKTFQTEVSIGDPFAKVASPAFLEEVLKRVGPEFTVAVGVALRKLEEEG